MKEYFCKSALCLKQKTRFYDVVKTPVFAGMQFGSKNYKMQKVAYKKVKIYYSNPEKNDTVGMEDLGIFSLI